MWCQDLSVHYGTFIWRQLDVGAGFALGPGVADIPPGEALAGSGNGSKVNVIVPPTTGVRGEHPFRTGEFGEGAGSTHFGGSHICIVAQSCPAIRYSPSSSEKNGMSLPDVAYVTIRALCQSVTSPTAITSVNWLMACRRGCA